MFPEKNYVIPCGNNRCGPVCHSALPVLLRSSDHRVHIFTRDETGDGKCNEKGWAYARKQRLLLCVLCGSGLAQHGVQPGRMEESGPALAAGFDFVRDGRSMFPALTDHSICPGLGIIYYRTYTNTAMNYTSYCIYSMVLSRKVPSV
jgi:hypothetical protein